MPISNPALIPLPGNHERAGVFAMAARPAAVQAAGFVVRHQLSGQGKSREMKAFVTTPRMKLAAIVSAGAILALPLTGIAHAQAPGSQPVPPAAPPAAPAANPAGAPTTPPPPAPAVPDPAKAAEAGKGTPAVVVDGGTADTLLGKPVESADGEDMGRIIDVVVDRDGTMRAAIIDFGGFLGVGSRKIAVDWRVLHFAKDNMERVVAELSRDRLKVAPVYKAGEPIVIVGRADAATPPAATPPAATLPAGTPAPAAPPAAPQPAASNGASTSPPPATSTPPAPDASAPKP